MALVGELGEDGEECPMRTRGSSVQGTGEVEARATFVWRRSGLLLGPLKDHSLDTGLRKLDWLPYSQQLQKIRLSQGSQRRPPAAKQDTEPLAIWTRPGTGQM